MKPKICVIGSSNIDQFSYVDDIPGDGETVFGNSYETGFGGKGANQAIMAGLLGAETIMITCLGSAIFANLSTNSYILFFLNVTFKPAFVFFLVLKFDIDFLNLVITGI